MDQTRPGLLLMGCVDRLSHTLYNLAYIYCLQAARQTASIGIAFTFAITTSISLLGFGLRTFIGRMFSGDETVVSLVRSSFSIVAVFMV